MTSLDKKSTVSVGLGILILGFVGFLFREAGRMERVWTERAHGLETVVGIQGAKLDAIGDQLRSISGRLDIATAGLPEIRARITMIEERQDRLEKE